MQAIRDVQPGAEKSPYLAQKASKLPEYVYQAAILVAVLLILWTATA